MSKRVALLIAVALSLTTAACQPGLHGGGQSPSGWLTYTNTAFGYQVQYSPDWAYREFPGTRSGAGFRLKTAPADPQNEFIVVDAAMAPEEFNGQKTADMAFAEYVRIAAIAEIQGFEKLVSIEEVKADGLTGYVTTWEYQAIVSPGQTERRTSLPMAYFELNKTVNGRSYRTLQIHLDDAAYRSDFDQMVRTVRLTGR